MGSSAASSTAASTDRDDSLSPVPDLAAEPCAISSDLLVVTCVLRAATFHDGTPVTADDVAFTYQLLISDACRMPNFCTTAEGILLEGARAIDQRTIEFRLSGRIRHSLPPFCRT